MFTLKVTHLQVSSPVAPVLLLSHLTLLFTHTRAHSHTDCAGKEDATASKKLCQPVSTLYLTQVWAFKGFV